MNMTVNTYTPSLEIETQGTEAYLKEKSQSGFNYTPTRSWQTIGCTWSPEMENETLPDILPDTETLISEIAGVVLGTEKDIIRVRLAETVIVNFPRALFTDDNLARLGQPIKYQIKKAADGVRYQNIVADITPALGPEQMEILNILDGIELRED